MAGYLFELERALIHLASADSPNTTVGIETLDDVVVYDGDEIVIREQDKHSISGRVISTNSYAFWNTLLIWLADSGRADRYFLTTNTKASTALLQALQDPNRDAVKLLAQLRKAGSSASRNAPAIAPIVAEVLRSPDAKLTRLLKRVELCVNTDPDQTLHDRLVNGLAFQSSTDAESTVESLFGWIAKQALTCWRERRPAMFRRQALIDQCRAIERKQTRVQILPRASKDVPVTDRARLAAKGRRFLQHLDAIDAEDDDIEDAVRFYVQFNTEKHRLVRAGNIPDTEWDDRAERLRNRWRLIARVQKRVASRDPKSAGRAVLAETTYDHHEDIAGEKCRELYMTAGHYHRLADDDRVWWHPTSTTKKER